MSEERHFTDEQLKEKIQQMRTVSEDFYRKAVWIQNHPFIEFTGLMNEYINIAEKTMAEGRDFTLSNNHTGVPLNPHDYQVRYLAEKFECIFGPMLMNPKHRAEFFKGMDWPEAVQTEDAPAFTKEDALQFKIPPCRITNESLFNAVNKYLKAYEGNPNWDRQDYLRLVDFFRFLEKEFTDANAAPKT